MDNKLSMKKFSLVIPCYNEEKNLPILFTKINKNMTGNMEVIFVNNGSKDETKSLLENFCKGKKMLNLLMLEII